MHKVKRNTPPAGLIKKNKEWQKKLQKNHDINVDSEWKQFRATEIGHQTANSLDEMYLNCCMYCEGALGLTGYEQIEHFRPKSKYPDLCFEYDNLHIACQICNSNKGNKFDESYIDPTKQDPREHIEYIGWEAKGKDDIGSTMIELVKLNNSVRTNFRMGTCQKIQDRLKTIYSVLEYADSMNTEIKKLISDSLDDIYAAMNHGSPYCTMIKDNFEETVNLMYKKISE